MNGGYIRNCNNNKLSCLTLCVIYCTMVLDCALCFALFRIVAMNNHKSSSFDSRRFFAGNSLGDRRIGLPPAQA